MKKRKSFTLLELMVCLALISLLAGLVGMKGVDLLAHHRFYRGLQTWLFDIHRVQILAMNQGADVTCTLKKNKEGHYRAIFESDAPSFHSTSHDLNGVSELIFENKPINEFKVTFFSSGRISPVGILKIEPQKEQEPSVFLDFSYPIAFQTAPQKKSSRFIPPPYPEKKII
jgi:prepilin-type N-terminal cleavage/methylation domain-containing protein